MSNPFRQYCAPEHLDKRAETWYTVRFTNDSQNPMFKAKKTGQKAPRVAILGHRGIPNSYGGFEALAEALAKYFVGFGAKVSVYCRKQYFKVRPTEFQGAKLIYLSTITRKSLDTAAHTLFSIIHAVVNNVADVFVIVNVGNAPFALLARLLGKKVILCVDGLDWQRKKWGTVARIYLRACSHLAKIAANEIVTDAQSVQDFYQEFRKAKSTHIPYGTDIELPTAGDEDFLAEYGLKSKQYFIYVARLEPENNPLLVVKAYVRSGSKLPLVMIGGNRYNHALIEELKAAANENVIFLGRLFGARSKQLMKHSLAYIRAAEVGGISPAVIEAMGRGVCVIANDKSENREPLGDAGLFYNLRISELAKRIKQVTAHPEMAIERGKKSAERAMVLYSWNTICYEYFKLVKKLTEEKVITIPSVDVSKKRVLITGIDGVLAATLEEYFSANYNVRVTKYSLTDNWVNNRAFEQAVAAFRPDYIFHLGALADFEKYDSATITAKLNPQEYAAAVAERYGATLQTLAPLGAISQAEKFMGLMMQQTEPLRAA